jgi:excisionase family DNA binding protein
VNVATISPPQLLTIDDLAEYLRVSRATVRTWRARGGGPLGIKVGRHVRYRPEDVERWLDERKSEPLSEPDGLIAVADADARGGVVVAGGPIPNPHPGSSASRLAKGNRHGPSS